MYKKLGNQLPCLVQLTPEKKLKIFNLIHVGVDAFALKELNYLLLLKGCHRFFPDLIFFCKKKTEVTRFWTNLSQRVLKIFCSFLMQMKAENPYFPNQKFFTPSLFLAHFFDSGYCLILWIFYHIHWWKEGGKKLVRGKKLSIWKIWNLSFHLHKKLAENL